MKTKPAYLVIDTFGRTPTISHVRSHWPRLESGQIVVRVAVEIPDAALPQLQLVELEAAEAAMVEQMPMEVPSE